MLKRSLLTIAILGVLAGAAGAHSDGEVEKAKGLETPDVEFVLEAPPATCGATASEAQSEAWLDTLLEQQNASQLEKAESPNLYARRWGGSSRCYICVSGICWVVYC